MKFAYAWERVPHERAGSSYIADVDGHRLLVRRRAARSPWFGGKIDGVFVGMWRDSTRARQRMEANFPAWIAGEKKPAPPLEDAGS